MSARLNAHPDHRPMTSLRDTEFVKRYRPEIFAMLWLVFGIVMANLALQNQSIPGRDDLTRVSGIIDRLSEDSRHVRHGPDVYTLHLQLRGADTEYIIDSGRRNDAGAYARTSRALRRGSEITLWYEQHPALGNRPWQIDQQGQRLMDYRETFNHETDQQMNTWLVLLAYIVASAIVIPLLVMWRRRVLARYAAPSQPATENDLK